MPSSLDVATAPAEELAVARGLLLLCSAGVIWGTIGIAIALVDEASAMTSGAVTAYRSALAVAALAVAALATRQLRGALALAREHPGRVVAVGTLTATFQLLYFLSVLRAGVSIATVVTLGLPPVLLLLLDAVRRRRAPTPTHGLTVVTALVGLVLVALLGSAGPSTPELGVGLLLALGSGTAFALSADVAAPLSRRHGAVAVTTATLSVTALVLIPVGVTSELAAGGPLVPESARVWLLIAYLGVVTMALTYGLLFAGLRTTPSSAAVVAILLEPVTAVVLAAAFLGERLTVAGVLGSSLILAAIATLGLKRAPQPL